MSSSAVKAVILCGGKGFDLPEEGEELPKVLRPAKGHPLLYYVLEALSFLPREDMILVVGQDGQAILEAFPDYPHAVQDQPLGTGHALQAAQAQLDGFDGHVLVCCGDMPLLKRSTFQSLVATHLREGNACTLLSGVTEKEFTYGRILRDEERAFRAIVEVGDCSPEERSSTELNAGVYVFDTAELMEALSGLDPHGEQGGYYLGDVPTRLAAQGKKVGVCPTCTSTELLGVNSSQQLLLVEERLKGRLL